MVKQDYVKMCQDLMKECKLTLEDMAYIQGFTKAKNAEDLYYELEEMLRNNQIMIGGKHGDTL